MITAYIEGNEIWAEDRELRFSVDLDNLSPIQQIQMDCIGAPENLIYGLMLSFISHEIYDQLVVMKADVEVYNDRIDINNIPWTFIEPCEECRKKLEALEHDDADIPKI